MLIMTFCDAMIMLEHKQYESQIYDFFPKTWLIVPFCDIMIMLKQKIIIELHFFGFKKNVSSWDQFVVTSCDPKRLCICVKRGFL
jgi:hypothetical protein